MARAPPSRSTVCSEPSPPSLPPTAYLLMPSHSPSTYLPGCLVTYIPPTDNRCSQWRATITRGNTAADRYRARVTYNDGPDAAVRAALARFNEGLSADWTVLGVPLSLDGGTTYAYPVGPA